MGGSGVRGFNVGAGGAGGNGGSVVIDATTALGITFRDADLITGGEAETTVSTVPFVSNGNLFQNAYRAPSGSLGGKGTVVSGTFNRGGDGGAGGAAGSITVHGTLDPAVSFFTLHQRIIGYTSPPLAPLTPDINDNPLDTTKFSIGVTELTSDASGRHLYRLRLDDQNNTLGGSGGVPGGQSQEFNFPGNFGALGAGGAISGLPH
jgi:hypothetical protein